MVNIKKTKEVKLTKAGVARKPHIMTDKRKEAFAKCVQARLAKMQAKRQAREQDQEKAIADNHLTKEKEAIETES